MTTSPDWGNGAVPADRPRVVVVFASKASSITAFAASTHGDSPNSMASAEPTAGSPVALQGQGYVPPSSFNISSVVEEPSFAAAAAPVVARPTMLDALTGRQRDVLHLIVQGMSNKEIARALKLAEGTVKIHVAALFRKFGLYRRAAVAVVGAHLLSQLSGTRHGRELAKTCA